MHRNISTWTCIVLGYQLNRCVAPILIFQAGKSLTFFFSLMTDTHPTPCRRLIISPTLFHFGYVLTTIRHEQTTSRAVQVILSRRAIEFSPLSKSLRSAAYIIKSISQRENDSRDSLAEVKYLSHLITFSPRHPIGFFVKLKEGHNVLAIRCIYRQNELNKTINI